jgi:hypothetical protein
MAHKPTASLASLDLAALRVPLPVGRDRTDEPADDPAPARLPPHSVKSDRRPPQRVQPADISRGVQAIRAVLPPAPRKREHLVPYSIRIPLAMIEQLDELKRQDYVISDLLRNFIAKGLTELGVKEPRT